MTKGLSPDFEYTLWLVFVGRTGSLDLEGGWFVVIVCLGMNRSSWESWLKMHWGGERLPWSPEETPPSITESTVKNVFTMPTWRAKEISLKDI